MTKDELIEALKKIQNDLDNEEIDHTDLGNEEIDHIKADNLLLAYIDDERVDVAFHNIRKWYS